VAELIQRRGMKTPQGLCERNYSGESRGKVSLGPTDPARVWLTPMARAKH